MYVPIPVLIAAGLAMLGMIALLLSRRSERSDDLMRPPRSMTGRAAAVPVATPDMPAPLPAREPDEALAMEVRMLLAQGKKIQAIKHVRDRIGMGLKEAKDWVEAVERGEQ